MALQFHPEELTDDVEGFVDGGGEFAGVVAGQLLSIAHEASDAVGELTLEVDHPHEVPQLQLVPMGVDVLGKLVEAALEVGDDAIQVGGLLRTRSLPGPRYRPVGSAVCATGLSIPAALGGTGRRFAPSVS